MTSEHRHQVLNGKVMPLEHGHDMPAVITMPYKNVRPAEDGHYHFLPETPAELGWPPLTSYPFYPIAEESADASA